MDPVIRAQLQQGGVIPAHPLALTDERTVDEPRQRALTRYYADSGAVGVAVGVHTTQFRIHDPAVGLYEPVLRMAAEELDALGRSDIVRVAGLAGHDDQVAREARLARQLGYHVGLLSMRAWATETEARLLDHVRRAAACIPIMAFYLQPAVGGRSLSYDFWCRLLAEPNVVAVKVAAFDRYRTVDVARAVGTSGRAGDLALYTGNDDNIVADLLTTFQFEEDGSPAVRFVGGLLGQWAVGTGAAVALHAHLTSAVSSPNDLGRLLTVGAQYTDANGAIFDAAKDFAGCVPGINEVLRRDGFLVSNACLDPDEVLSPGQSAEITRVLEAYPHLWDGDRMRAVLQGRAAVRSTADEVRQAP